jgi:hypothetical protein
MFEIIDDNMTSEEGPSNRLQTISVVDTAAADKDGEHGKTDTIKLVSQIYRSAIQK